VDLLVSRGGEVHVPVGRVGHVARRLVDCLRLAMDVDELIRFIGARLSRGVGLGLGLGLWLANLSIREEAKQQRHARSAVQGEAQTCE